VDTKRLIAAPLLLGALGLAACGGGGGGSSDKDTLTKIVTDGGKTPATICDHLDAKTLANLGGHDKCVQASKQAGALDPNVKVTKLTINGDKATANITGKDGSSTIHFVKENGDWKVTGG
jgi:hypothetical protein